MWCHLIPSTCGAPARAGWGQGSPFAATRGCCLHHCQSAATAPDRLPEDHLPLRSRGAGALDLPQPQPLRVPAEQMSTPLGLSSPGGFGSRRECRGVQPVVEQQRGVNPRTATDHAPSAAAQVRRRRARPSTAEHAGRRGACCRAQRPHHRPGSARESGLSPGPVS